jgi:hypothetical protein
MYNKAYYFWTRRLQGDLHPCANTPLTSTPAVREKTGSNNPPFVCRTLYDQVCSFSHTAGVEVAQSVKTWGDGPDYQGAIPCRCNDGIFLSSPPNPDRLWNPSSLLSNGYRPGGEADHSPPSNADVKNECSYISAPPIRLGAG